MRHLLTLFDFSPGELTRVLAIAAELKAECNAGIRKPTHPGYLLGLLFEKPSLRTRVSFESAMAHLGGNAVFLGPESGWGTRESLKDFTEVLTSYVDAVVYRGTQHSLLEQFAAHANCPVINGLTDSSHPCQAISDLFTMSELHGDLTNQTLVFVGDGNNVARSLSLACAMAGARFVLAAPEGYQLSHNYVDVIKSAYPQARIEQVLDPREAIGGAQIIYSDVWTSMGQELETAARRAAFARFQVNAEMLRNAGTQVRFMHCLPANRAEEVTDEVMDSPQSAIVQQAANRLHVQKAILVWLFDQASGGQQKVEVRENAIPSTQYPAPCEFAMPRPDARHPDQLRPLSIQRHYTSAAAGSVLISAGQTTVICTASVERHVPPWLEGKGKGWITAEYSMLPGSTSPRKPRDRKKVDGRTTEIQRLIGRSLRAVADLEALGEQMITVDCDVLRADGGTRTLAITGALVALVDAIQAMEQRPDPHRFPLRDSVAAVSVGVVDGQPVLDLPYVEDVIAAVDMNVVMTGNGRYVEVQGTGEEATFSDEELAELLRLAKIGMKQLTSAQRESLGHTWPFGTEGE